MPLYDVTHAKAVLVKVKDAEAYEVILAVKRRVPSVTWARIVKTVDEAIDSCEPSAVNKLVWTKMGALFGNAHMQPGARVDHLWEKVIGAVGDDKNCLKAVGGLLRWRISVREETWLVYRRDTDECDPVTGKVITVSEYWVNDEFVPPGKFVKPLVSGVQQLKQAWGAR